MRTKGTYQKQYLPGVAGPVNANSVIIKTCICSMNREGCKLLTVTRSMPNLHMVSISNCHKPFKELKTQEDETYSHEVIKTKSLRTYSNYLYYRVLDVSGLRNV